MDELKPKVGTIGWLDLTVAEASPIRDFYQAVIGWDSSEQEMEGYSDFNMLVGETKKVVAGVCHARAENADLPAQWVVYVWVADAKASAAAAEAQGGRVLKWLGDQFCVIQDPAGAVMGLMGVPK
ncbi:MAG TPA: VOC family protein [Tepidisphaeraceae bacterium]|nr:VOC family protein [Tepidisphaeraceae bacterium]